MASGVGRLFKEGRGERSVERHRGGGRKKEGRCWERDKAAVHTRGETEEREVRRVTGSRSGGSQQRRAIVVRGGICVAVVRGGRTAARARGGGISGCGSGGRRSGGSGSGPAQQWSGRRTGTWRKNGGPAMEEDLRLGNDEGGVAAAAMAMYRRRVEGGGLWDPHTSFGGVPDTFRFWWSGGGAASEDLFRREGQYPTKTEFVVCIQQVLCMGHAGLFPDVLDFGGSPGGRPRPVLITAATCTRNKCDEQQQKQRKMKRNVSRGRANREERGSGRVLTGERESVRPPATFLATTGPPTTAWSRPTECWSDVLGMEDVTRGSRRLASSLFELTWQRARRIGRRHVAGLRIGLSLKNLVKKWENVLTRIPRHILRQLKREKIDGELDADDIWTNRLAPCALARWANQRLPRGSEPGITHIV
ncbi:hypothetical protein Scep_026371 [Stephania cephalantha]|uniref:Uncharacterized protein n=1 Tax=Stephania cephalantha TaxID=152367 RepID=A0AAP0HS02_9MAGN